MVVVDCFAVLPIAFDAGVGVAKTLFPLFAAAKEVVEMVGAAEAEEEADDAATAEDL